MSQIMFELAARTNAPLQEALKVVVGARYQAEILESPDKESLAYRPSDAGIEDLFALLNDGTIVSFLVRPDDGRVSWAAVYEAGFDSRDVEMLTLVWEYRGADYQAPFEECLKVAELLAIIVSMEETLELTKGSLAPDGFPWDHWRLLTAAVRSDTQSHWSVRVGPAAKTQ